MSNTKYKEISVIIPVYKEEKRLKESLPTIVKYLTDTFDQFEILIALDPPKGNTETISRNIYKHIKFIENVKRMGKGYSVKSGMLVAQYEIVLFLDADLSTPISAIETLFPHIDEYPLVIGSRNLAESNIKGQQAILRNALGNVYPLIVRTLIINDLKDTQCGFKLFRKEIIRPVFLKQTINGFAFDTEILLIAKKLGYKIKEVPIEWSNSSESKLNVFKDPFIMGIDVFKIFINKIKGVYDGN